MVNLRDIPQAKHQVVLNAAVTDSIMHGVGEYNYAGNMHDAWKLYMHFIPANTRYNTYTPQALLFSETLLERCGSDATYEIYPALDILRYIREWTPKMITIAALIAYGVEVVENEV